MDKYQMNKKELYEFIKAFKGWNNMKMEAAKLLPADELIKLMNEGIPVSPGTSSEAKIRIHSSMVLLSEEHLQYILLFAEAIAGRMAKIYEDFETDQVAVDFSEEIEKKIMLNINAINEILIEKNIVVDRGEEEYNYLLLFINGCPSSIRNDDAMEYYYKTQIMEWCWRSNSKLVLDIKRLCK